MKNAIILTILFAVATILGACFGEVIFKTASHTFGNEVRYDRGRARLETYNLEIDAERNKLYQQNQPFSELRETPEWKELELKNNKISIKIYSITKLSMLVISVFGLVMLNQRRKNNNEFEPKHWLFVFLSLFFMRESIIALLNTLNIWTCSELHAWIHLTKYVFRPQYVIMALGALIFIATVALIPKNKRILFFISGFFGSVIGFYFWIFWVGRILF
ncbi:MAG: hypothetical protein H6607_05870 [Flavobacteriales bacterium]|nr:hypothetical protein [Flavobacteriales bacterium]